MGAPQKPYLAIDPGGTTGLCEFNPNALEVGASTVLTGRAFERSELGPDEHHRALWKKLAGAEWKLIICESFEFRQGARPGLDLSPKEYIGIVKLYSAMTGTPVVFQTAGLMKGGPFKPRPVSESDRDLLKRMGLYEAPGGRQHMNDATRHMLHYLVTKENRTDLLQRVRPQRQGG